MLCLNIQIAETSIKNEWHICTFNCKTIIFMKIILTELEYNSTLTNIKKPNNGILIKLISKYNIQVGKVKLI